MMTHDPKVIQLSQNSFLTRCFQFGVSKSVKVNSLDLPHNLVQVNQNFEHLSREMAQLSDHVTRTQQEDLGGKGWRSISKWSYGVSINGRK